MRKLLRYSIIGLLGVGTGVLLYHYAWRRVPAAGAAAIEQHNLVIEQVRALGQIELLQYQVRDVLRREWSYVIPLTRSRVLLVVAGEARICMDFTGVQVVEADWEKRSLKLALPEPTLCLVRIDPAQSQVYDADFSVIEWWSGGEAERMREALAAAQETLRTRLTRQLPTETARIQGETLIRRLCESMGWQKVTFVKQPTPRNPTAG